ncbi:MAG: hypothetical protein IPP72_00680 [Chitinophagaceae bacterium]|nr:hypothetical protein [Chitinophagaceae bacterium]
MKQFSFLVLMTTAVLLINAQTVTTWQGPSTGGSWMNPANWDNGVPTAAATEIVFDGSVGTLSGGIITITDVQQTNPNFSYDKLTVINSAIVTLSSSSATYLYLNVKADIETGSRLNVGAATGNLFIVGGTLSTIFNINGTLDLQGQGIGNSTRTAFEPTTSFFGTAVTTIRGTLILSGKVAVVGQSTPANFILENGGKLNVIRDGGTVPNGNYKDGSLIKVEGVVNTGTGFVSATYNGVIEWNCPGQTVGGASVIILPSSSFNSIDSLVINNTGSSGKAVRLATNPGGYYVKNIIVNGGVLEFGSPTGSGPYTAKVDNIIQNGGTLVGNAPGVPGFDNAFENDTISVSGNFIQNGGVYDFSTRTPNNATPNASSVLQIAGNVKIGGTVKLSQAVTAPNCALVFNGAGTQDFEITNTGSFTNKIKTVLNNTSLVSGVNAVSNITLPDSLVFKLGYLFLNNFDLTNPLPVLPVANPFQTHVVTNGTGFFIQKKVKIAPVGIPIGASTTTVNPLIIGFLADSLDVAARVEPGINPTIALPAKAINRTWQIKPLGIPPSNLAVSFGYSDLTPFPGDGNPLFSYSANNEVGLYDGANWQVISLPGGIAPAGTNPYAISHVILSSLMQPNVAMPLAIANVSGVTPLSNLINLAAAKSGNSALLRWDIKELTTRISRFEILRSKDGRNFISLGTETALVNQMSYSFTDNNLQPGVNYYRIKMFESSGSFKYSVIVAVINKAKGTIITSVVPTIVSSDATVIISSAVEAPVQLNITDMMGRLVRRATAVLNAGNNQLNIDCRALPAGTYQLAGYSLGTQTNIVRFVKQ